MQAAAQIGMPSLGYANKPGKDSRLAQANARAVVTSLADLVISLRGSSF
jgi:hypothetical protein